MPSSTSRTDLESVRKFPWQWAVMTLCGTIGAVFGLYNMRVNQSDATCQERIGRYAGAISRKDSIIFYWQSKYINLSTELLYKNNIIDRQQTLINKTDSLTRTKLEKPAKLIVKNHDK